MYKNYKITQHGQFYTGFVHYMDEQLCANPSHKSCVKSSTEWMGNILQAKRFASLYIHYIRQSQQLHCQVLKFLPYTLSGQNSLKKAISNSFSFKRFSSSCIFLILFAANFALFFDCISCCNSDMYVTVSQNPHQAR